MVNSKAKKRTEIFKHFQVKNKSGFYKVLSETDDFIYEKTPHDVIGIL